MSSLPGDLRKNINRKQKPFFPARVSLQAATLSSIIAKIFASNHRPCLGGIILARENNNLTVHFKSLFLRPTLEKEKEVDKHSTQIHGQSKQLSVRSKKRGLRRARSAGRKIVTAAHCVSSPHPILSPKYSLEIPGKKRGLQETSLAPPFPTTTTQPNAQSEGIPISIISYGMPPSIYEARPANSN